MEDLGSSQELNINQTDQPPGIGPGANLSDIELLKDRFEQQKAYKLKAEQLVSTLSKIKAREKATRRTIKPGEKKVEDGVPSQTTKRSGTNSSSALKEKSNLLKKKLEEDRAKFESKKGQDDLGRVSQIVEHIRVQLEDQDKTIQQMHNSFVTTSRTQLVEEVSPESDIPPEIKQKIADLEMKIIDLQENLREKDSVISARTQAITLLSEDMARKGKNTLDTLEETRCQMKMMQANFVALEDRMNEERTRLREELEAKKNRLQQIEKNYRTAESARYELSTRVAELQEKVVAFQTKNIALEEEIVESNARLKDLQEALESSNKQTIKMKAQFKTKLKALEEERDALRKDNATNDELNQLRERIAELEDEKEAGNMLKERIAEMEEKLLRQESDLDSHIKAMSSLETDKLDLIEEGNRRTGQLKEKEETLHLLHAQIKEIEGTKIASEIKCLELEEKLDNFMKSNTDIDLLNSELENVKQKLLEYQETINELTLKLESKENEISNINNQASSLKDVQDLSTSLKEWQTRYSALEEKLNESLTYCKELEIKKKSLEEHNDKLSSECNHLNDSIVKLNSIINSRSESKDEEVVLLKQNLTEKEIEINNVKELNKSLETEVDSLRYALESTTAELHRLSQQLEQFSYTQQKLEELTAEIECKDSELVQTSSELEKRSRKLSEYKKFHKLKSEDVIRISHELETVTLTFQQKVSELEAALSLSQKNEDILAKELKDLKENVGNVPDSGDLRFQEQSIKMKKLAANVKLKNKLVKDLESRISELEHTLQEKDLLITSLENKTLCFQNQITDPSSLTSSNLEEKCKIQDTEIMSLKESLKLREEELDSLKNSSIENYETLVQIKELENTNKQLNDITETKSEQLKKMEDEVSDLNGLNKSLLSELEQLQETYKQDALKNESVLESFEHEMLGNKRDILELSNQLKEVTSKYQQTWAKLQEKEGYIEELEQQLEKVKSRLIHIENTVEEGRRSFEERAELLGARLSAAEKSNEQLEKHEGELERKITHLINTEEIMGNLIQKLQDENCEITKSLNESVGKNVQISKELENKCAQIHNFNKEIIDLKTNLANYENIIEEYEMSKTQLKESQNSNEHQLKMLKNRFLESEQCLEAEIQRLLGKVAQLEAERQDFADQYNSLLLEKQKLEEELYHLQQTVADVTREDIEQIKVNHKNLAEELNKELEKRQAHIYRIQELEIELSNQKNNSGHFNTQYNEEMLSLKSKLEKELKENELLRYEIVKQKAKRQVEDVVSKAEQTYFTMTSKSDKDDEIEKEKAKKQVEEVVSKAEQPYFTMTSTSDKDDSELTFSLQESTSAPLLSTYANKSRPEGDDINALKLQISALDSENQSLKLRLQELEHHCRLPKSNIEADSDDWTAITRDDDDGWGWGSKDAMLEHEHLQKQQIHSELEAKVLEFEEKSFNMEEENKKLNEDLKASQAKCNKLLKKLKEFKNKSDSLERNSREKSVGFDDLDIAMQEELKCQIEKLEKNLKECNSNVNTLQSERTGLLKKIDVLTYGNERLVEMKERQDIEVEMWQRRSNELQNKVQGLEWTLAEMHAEQSEYKDAGKSNLFADEERQHFLKSALEMEEKINILAAENDYLQSLIVELKDKDKNCNLTISGSKGEVTQQSVEYNDYLHLQQENDRLKGVIKTIEQKQNTEDNFADYCHEIEKLKKENELLSTEIRNLRQQSTIEVRAHDCVNMNEHDNSVVTENKYLKSKITSLEEELVCLKITCDQLKEDTRKQINQNESSHVDSPVQGGKDEHNSSGKAASDNDTPVLFRGFTSSDSDGIFEMCIGNQVKAGPIANDKISREYPISTSDNQQIGIFDETEQGAEESLKKVEEVDMSKETLNTIEIQELKKSQSEKDSEISFLKSSLAELKEENNDIKKQMEGQSFQNPIVWDLLPGLPSNELPIKNNQQWGSEVNDLNKKLEEQDVIIGDLRQKLNIKNNLFDVSQISNDSFNELFSQTENSQESQVNFFVEQITLLTKTLHDKEVEIEELNDKKEKYKEMYHTFVKEYDIQSPEHSNSDKEQLASKNIFMNRLFEDKETELEMMSQQIEQNIAAKENLQDELCLKLSEMEACDKTYTTPKVHEDMLHPSQPENIEDVRALCAEVTDLTKLLNEQESELEILKQKLDEANLEKENLIDEWNKTIEEYKQKYKHANDKCAHFQHELATLKHSIESDDKKQYMEELSLKNEQLTNALNDLSSVNNLYQDMQIKLNNVETNLKTSQMQNNHLTTEINYLKEIQKSLQDVTQDIEEVDHLNLVQKVEFLKTSYFDTNVKLADLESEFKEKENEVFALKEKVNDLEKTNNFSAESDFDSPIRVKTIKSLSSEPSRMSTVTAQSSALQLETGQGQMMLLKEIQSLKQVLAMKDSEITKMSIALNDAQENLIRGEMRLINSEETRLKQRLDEALYTLHLRDVRCDELEQELMQLLEERDSLQLRLSTAIRFNEELREKYKLLDEAELKQEVEDRASVDGDENSQQLKQKLDQLHNVGYRRDPAMQQDQQKRYQEQMHLYTHDSSQDESQSSSGFFNWIFGASTSGSQDI